MGHLPAFALLIPLSALAGCIGLFNEKETSPVDDTTPPPGTAELLGYYTLNYHAPHFEVYAAPNGTGGFRLPSSCLAFRNATQRASDTCDVLEEAPTYYGPPPDLGPWLVHAVWDGDRFSNELGDDWMNVVCYDEAGVVEARWRGQYHPEAVHATE